MARRDFLKLTAIALAAGLSGISLSTCSTIELKNRPIRREINSLAAAKDIDTFKLAVSKMKALPSTNVRSWEYQASIHAAFARHRSWLFFPWHRAYLYYFEQICREVTGETNFALPYWNWTANPQVPAVFWDTASPLYYSVRGATPTSVAANYAVGSAVVTPMLDEPNFLLFAGAATVLNDPNRFGPGYGRIEETPHNYIHGFVGGFTFTPRSMNDNMWSPIDPIFWTHHCHIDQLWAQWNILKDNPNTNDTRWTDTEFHEFFDNKGNPVVITPPVTAVLPLFAYQYDS